MTARRSEGRLTLSQALLRQGMLTQPGREPGKRDILLDGRVVLYNQRAGQVWRWLKNRQKESAE